MAQTILVIGATGKQGGAFIDAVLNSPDASSFTLLALTRNPASPAAQKLIEKNVKIVEGDLADVPGVFAKAKQVGGAPIWGVFVVLVSQGPSASPQIEEKQGKAIVDEAISSYVKYFCYSSVDRGGEERSWQNPTYVPHFISKHNIELYLREKAEPADMMWTILRPTAFMDNCNPGYFSQIFMTTWRMKLPEKKFQLISTGDIGRFAFIVFQSPDVYNERAISLAGSAITHAEAQEIFKDRTHIKTGIPEAYEFLAKGLLWAVKDIAFMFDWFVEEGYGANIDEVKKIYPRLQDWATWLEEESAWIKRD